MLGRFGPLLIVAAGCGLLVTLPEPVKAPILAFLDQAAEPLQSTGTWEETADLAAVARISREVRQDMRSSIFSEDDIRREIAARWAREKA